MFSSLAGWVWSAGGSTEQPQWDQPTKDPELGEPQAVPGPDGDPSIEADWAVVIAGEEGGLPSTLELNLDTDGRLVEIAEAAPEQAAAALALLEAEPVFSTTPTPPGTGSEVCSPTVDDQRWPSTHDDWLPSCVTDSMCSDLSQTDAELLRMELDAQGQRDFPVQKKARSPTAKAKTKAALQERMEQAAWSQDKAPGRGSMKRNKDAVSRGRPKHVHRTKLQTPRRPAKQPSWKQERRQAIKGQ